MNHTIFYSQILVYMSSLLVSLCQSQGITDRQTDNNNFRKYTH